MSVDTKSILRLLHLCPTPQTYLNWMRDGQQGASDTGRGNNNRKWETGDARQLVVEKNDGE
jgi:hypothetical protein